MLELDASGTFNYGICSTGSANGDARLQDGTFAGTDINFSFGIDLAGGAGAMTLMG